jgi:hypothetical protein
MFVIIPSGEEVAADSGGMINDIRRMGFLFVFGEFAVKIQVAVGFSRPSEDFKDVPTDHFCHFGDCGGFCHIGFLLWRFLRMVSNSI